MSEAEFRGVFRERHQSAAKKARGSAKLANALGNSTVAAGTEFKLAPAALLARLADFG